MIAFDPGFGAAILVGLLGSSHCIGMCGGIVSALNLGLDARSGGRAWPLILHHLGYNAGRIASYGLVGLVAGGLGQRLVGLGLPPQAGRLFAALFLIALGLYLANWWRGLAVLERWGAKLWRYIQPLGARLLPVSHPGQAFLLGMLWGWLPCGLVYAVLAWALTTGDPVSGALLMLGFGLGTLPALLVAGNAFQVLSKWVRAPYVRTVAGALLIGLGLYSAYTGLAAGGGPHSQHMSAQTLTQPAFERDSSCMPAILHSMA